MEEGLAQYLCAFIIRGYRHLSYSQSKLSVLMLAPTLKAHLSKEQAKRYPVNDSNMGSPSTLLSVRLESYVAQPLRRLNLPSLPLRYIVSCDTGDSIGIAHAHNAMMMGIAGRGPSSVKTAPRTNIAKLRKAGRVSAVTSAPSSIS